MGYLSWSTPTTAAPSDPCHVTAVCLRGHPWQLSDLQQEYNQRWNLLFRFSTWDQGQGKAAGLDERESPEALFGLKSTIALARQLCLNGSAQKEGRTFVVVFWL